MLIFPRRTRFNGEYERSVFCPVEISDDPGFSDRFDVYATIPEGAGSVLTPELRALFVAMAEDGPVRALIDPELALIFGPDPLQSGKAAPRRASAEEVGRPIVRTFGAILGTLRDFRAQLA